MRVPEPWHVEHMRYAENEKPKVAADWVSDDPNSRSLPGHYERPNFVFSVQVSDVMVSLTVNVPRKAIVVDNAVSQPTWMLRPDDRADVPWLAARAYLAADESRHRDQQWADLPLIVLAGLR